MAREEEIKSYLKERNIPFNSLEANSIIEGAKWADKTTIEKVSEWLLDNTGKYMVVTGGGYWFKDIEFIRDLKRYLEK